MNAAMLNLTLHALDCAHLWAKWPGQGCSVALLDAPCMAKFRSAQHQFVWQSRELLHQCYINLMDIDRLFVVSITHCDVTCLQAE